MDLKRKAYDQLLEWKEKYQGRRAVLLEGPRRVGKSYLARMFGEKEYASYILIDFSNPLKGVMELFEDGLDDMDLFFNRLSAFYGTKLYRRNSLIIFDEVQRYPHARELIKHLVEDGRYDYLETGSLISIKSNIENIVIPSEEKSLRINSLDFEEFLWALGNESLYPLIKGSFDTRTPMGDAMHRKAMNAYRQYILIGGMPQAVISYVSNKDFELADEEKSDILNLYRNDIRKFAKGYHTKVLSIFDDIPQQLSKKEKKFNLASIEKDARMREYEDSFVWLADGHIINPCFNSTDPTVGLALNMDRLTQKCYMADTGLLVTMVFNDNNITDNDVYRAILSDRLHVNEGMITENFVAQSLVASGHRLFFYSRYGNDKEDRMEIDFLIVRSRKICPIEVKSSKNIRHTSLDKFRSKFSSRIGESFILYPGDVKTQDGIQCLPIYMAGLL